MPHKSMQNSKQASTFNISIKFNLSDGSPEPFTLDLFGIAPFPIWVQTGALVTVTAQITLEEVIDVGAKVSFNIVREGTDCDEDFDFDWAPCLTCSVPHTLGKLSKNLSDRLDISFDMPLAPLEVLV